MTRAPITLPHLLTVRVSAAQLAYLTREAQREARPIAWVIRRAIEAERLLRLPASDDKAFALIARREGTTVAAVIRRAVKAEVLKSNRKS